MPNTELNSLENRRQDLKNILGGMYEELPLTTTGKVIRRLLRDSA